MSIEFENVRLPRRRWLGHMRRLIKCSLYSFLPTLKTYSSHYDDCEILEFVKDEFEAGGIYLDVGSNDPIHASNTYLYYRLGFKGICIDPNADFSLFYRLFRPRDIFIVGACSDRVGISALNGISSSTSAISSKENSDWSILVPTFVLDQILDIIDIKSIAFLTIDTEGHEFLILKSAPEILSKTHVVLAESHTAQTDVELMDLLSKHNFIMKKRVGLNLLFVKV